jgi:pilus assembly protein FimV
VASAPAPARPASAVAAAAKKPAPPPPEPSVLDDLLENPLVPALGVGLLAVLLGLGFYKMRQKRKTAAVDSSFLESRLQPDSFFGASGGQRIDTAETNNPTGSSMVYSPSQLDAAGDVDPVAEADVYLAYGRDLQAEEILKEALRINPQRVAIHAKLLEIYAKRRDVKAFEMVAAEAYNLTHGSGPEWEHICELGRELDASNPMYRAGGQPGDGSAAAAAAAAAATSHTSTVAFAAPPAAAAAAAPVPDLDLDLDFSLGDEPETAAPPPPAPARAAKAAPAPTAAPIAPLDMDFALPSAPAAAVPQLDLPPVSAPQPVRLDAPDMTLDSNSINFDVPSPPPPPAPKAAPAPAPASSGGMMEFDLGGLSLDLPDSAPAPAPAPAPAAAAPKAAPVPAAMPALDPDATLVGGSLSMGGDTAADSPLATKLALAEEFNAIGDADGARSLAEEVLAEASGDLKSRAQRLLAEIG